jgi:hypothetical protein
MTLTAHLIKAANVLSTVALFVVASVYGTFLAHPSIIDIEKRHQTLLSPHLYVVIGFWTLEVILLVGFCIVQYRPSLNKPIVEGVYVWLAVANILIIAWTFLWLQEKLVLAAVVIFIQWVVLQLPLRNFNQHIALQSPLHNDNVAYFFVRVPMSLYAGWALVDVFYNVAVAYTHAPPDDQPATYKILAMVFLVLIGLGGAKARKDVYYITSMAVYLLGIGIHQFHEPLIAATALVIGFLGLGTAGLYKLHLWRRTHEQAPLLGRVY